MTAAHTRTADALARVQGERIAILVRHTLELARREARVDAEGTLGKLTWDDIVDPKTGESAREVRSLDGWHRVASVEKDAVLVWVDGVRKRISITALNGVRS